MDQLSSIVPVTFNRTIADHHSVYPAFCYADGTYNDGLPVVPLPTIIDSEYVDNALLYHGYWMRIYDSPKPHSILSK